VEKMKIDASVLIYEYKTFSAYINPNVGDICKVRKGIHRRNRANETLSMCTVPYAMVPNDVPYAIGKTIHDQPLKPYEESYPRENRCEFRSELAHFDRGGSSTHVRCTKCHKVEKIKPESLIADALEEPCNCVSKPHDIKPCIVSGTIIYDYLVYPNHKCKFAYCIGDTVCRNYEGHQGSIPGEALVKCSGGDLDV
jgi:hypothetical protein